MKENLKHVLRIYVPHRSFAGRPALEQVFDVLKEEVDRINKQGLQKHLIELELQDCEKERDLSNPSSSTFQSAETLRKTAENAHAVFVLVDSEMNGKTKDWYQRQIRKVMREKDEDKVPMPVFWKTASPDSRENYREFCEEFKDDCDYIETFETLDQFRERAAHWLEELSFRWAARITRGKEVPTLASNRSRKLKRRLLIGLILALLCAGLCLLFPYVKGMYGEAVPGDATGQPAAGRQSEPARDSLLNEAGNAGQHRDSGETRTEVVPRIKNTVYINVDAHTYESNYNDQLKSIIERRMIRRGYSPVADRSSAQYEIKVEGRPTDATPAHIIHLDVIVRITDLETGKLTCSTKNTYKDGSNSDEAAAMKIYRRIADETGQIVSNSFIDPTL